jgi:hypothetical protein
VRNITSSIGQLFFFLWHGAVNISYFYVHMNDADAFGVPPESGLRSNWNVLRAQEIQCCGRKKEKPDEG